MNFEPEILNSTEAHRLKVKNRAIKLIKNNLKYEQNLLATARYCYTAKRDKLKHYQLISNITLNIEANKLILEVLNNIDILDRRICKNR